MSPKAWIVLAVIALFLVGKTLRGRNAHKHASEAMAAGAVVLDVRTAGEWQQKHHPDAIHIPLDELEGRISELGPTNTPVVVYCRSGARAVVAARSLRKAGFQTVINVGGLGNVPRKAE